MNLHERPGVYTDLDLSTVWTGSKGSKTVAMAVQCDLEGLASWSSAAEASVYLSGDALELARLLFQNGAGSVMAYPVSAATAAGYSAAASALLAERKASYLICDSTTAAIHAAIKTAVLAAANEGNECIALFGMGSSTVSDLTAAASALGSERVVLVSGTAGLAGTESTGAIYGPAALAGLLARQTDPALPVNGVKLEGLAGVSQHFTETQLDTLVQGGVTQLEDIGGEVSAVRAVTTRTQTGGTPDASWRELTTIMIVDEVIPALRNALKARFLQKKNNESTRGAIRSLVAEELEKRVKREIIDSYGDIHVEPDPEDPTMCQVSFSFAVASGLNRIRLTAHITV